MWYHALLTLTTIWLCLSELLICMGDRVQKLCSMYNEKLTNSTIICLWYQIRAFWRSIDHCSQNYVELVQY